MDATEFAPDPLQRGVEQAKAQAGFSLAFGGEFDRDAARLRAYAGVKGQSIHGLLIEAGEGLGGRALLERQTRFTADYSRTAWITNRYGREVRAEGIVTLLAVPIAVDGSVRALLYAGFRDAVQLGNDIGQRAARIARNVAWEFSVHDEVRRRISLLETERLESVDGASQARSDLRERYAELRDLARTVENPDLRRRIEEVGERLIGRPTGAPGSATAVVSLSPREKDVLALVALGYRNSQIARRLDLTENTVKKYLSSAMTKLGANSRLDALLRARLRGLMP